MQILFYFGGCIKVQVLFFLYINIQAFGLCAHPLRNTSDRGLMDPN